MRFPSGLHRCSLLLRGGGGNKDPPSFSPSFSPALAETKVEAKGSSSSSPHITLPPPGGIKGRIAGRFLSLSSIFILVGPRFFLLQHDRRP